MNRGGVRDAGRFARALHGDIGGAVRLDGFERSRVRPPGDHQPPHGREHDVHSRVVALARLLEHDHDAIGVRIWDGVQQQVVDDAEHCGGRADPEGEGEHGDRGPSLLATQRPSREPQVLDDRVDELRARGAALSPGGDGDAGIARGREVAEPLAGGGSGVRLGHAARYEVAHAHLDMEAQLIVEIGDASGPEEPEVATPGARVFGARRRLLLRIPHHAVLGEISRTRVTAVANFAQ